MRLAIAAILSACMAGAPAALATPLDKGACDTLKIERDMLSEKGVATDMERGPEWAKINLPNERLGEIARFIELDEQLMFRCGRSTAQPSAKTAAKTDKDDPGKDPKGKASGNEATSDSATGKTAPQERIAKETEGPTARPPPAAPPAAAAKPTKPAPAKTTQRKKKPAPPPDDIFGLFSP